MPSFVTPVHQSRVGMSTSVQARSEAESTSEGGFYGRVVDVILDSSHPQYQRMGGTQALYGVFYQPILERSKPDANKTEKDYLQFAYCKQNALRQIPIKSEIVSLAVGLASLGVEDRGSNVDQEKIYWTGIVPVWNHPHLNIYPDTYRMQNKGQDVVDLGPDFEENSAIRPLQLNAGDVVLEGRHGQSLRFGGTTSFPNEVTKKDSNGYPYTILRNGQATTKASTCVEDVNGDAASIYLTSKHQVPIVEANRKYAGAVKAPGLAKDYKGKQIVANSDQVVINAREDNLILSAKKHASINAKSTSIDGDDYVGIDGDAVYLGVDAKTKSNPVLKGEETVILMKDLWNALNTFLSAIAKPAPPPAWVPDAAAQAAIAAASIKSILARIDSIKSKKVFTE